MLTEKGTLISTASLIRATSNGDPDAVRALLADGADVDQRGRGGHTALMVAAIFGHVDIARLLLSSGASVQLQDNLGLTARDWADRRGSWEVAQLLSNTSPETDISPKDALEKQAQLKVGVERRNPAAAPKPAAQPDTLAGMEEQSGLGPGAVVTLSTTGAARHEVEEVRREAEPDLPATEPQTAPEPDALRFMKFHKQIMAAQERLKAEQAHQVTNDAPRLAPREAAATRSSTGANRGVMEANIDASPIETKDTAPQQDAPSVAVKQVTTTEPELREKLARPTATDSAKIAATIEHLKLLEESSRLVAGDVPAQSDWAARTGVDQTLDHVEDDITLERLTANIHSRPTTVEPNSSESFNEPPSKRCPECNASYDNPLVKYCAYDAAKLISADDPMLSSPATRDKSRQTLWVLVAIVTVLGASLGYLINNYRSRGVASSAPLAAASGANTAAASNAPIATHTEQPEATRNISPSISGELSGLEVDVPEPEYPAQARNEGLSGAVTVRIRVNQKGKVVLARSSGGDWRLRAAAVKAAQKTTFSPEKLATRGKFVSGTITYNFVSQTESEAARRPRPSEQTDSTPANDSSTATASPALSVGGDYPVVGGPLVGADRNLPQPTYPQQAKSKGIYGAITVVVRVNRAGRVISWRTLEGDSQLRAAALKAAKRATFSPAKLPGKGEVVGSITYNFKP